MSLRMFRVVRRTRKEKMKVQMGSAIFHEGCKREERGWLWGRGRMGGCGGEEGWVVVGERKDGWLWGV